MFFSTQVGQRLHQVIDNEKIKFVGKIRFSIGILTYLKHESID